MRFCGERLLIPTALCPHRSFGYAPWEDPGGHKVNETGGGGGGRTPPTFTFIFQPYNHRTLKGERKFQVLYQLRILLKMVQIVFRHNSYSLNENISNESEPVLQN